ncbi:MAG: OadG family transporter subunit [Lachnospiraceae bacterium]|nr:OadG family transporter subunit [Lachnospiraceae bacterium]
MKKIKLVLVLAACLFGLTACSEAKVVDEQTAAYLGQMSVQVIQNAYATVDSNTAAELTAEGPEYLEYVFQNAFQMPVDGNGMISAFDSWARATDEIGSLVSVDDYSAEFDTSGDSIIVNVGCTFEKKTADVQFIYKTDLYNTLKSSATNIDYTFGEKMAKAGLNTLMGMGTVFAVLILIYGLISLFNFIPKIEAALSKKNEAEKPSPVDNAIAQIAEKEELTDDLELVAVITAAIAASEGSTSTDGYVVRSIRRVSGSKWQKA